MDRAEKERLQSLTYELTGIRVNGLAGLYVYFLLLATAWMERDGVAAWLIPSEFMDVNYGAALRRFFTDHMTLLRIHRFDPDEVQFGDALVSSAVVVFQKTAPPVNHAAQFSFGGSLSAPQATESIGLNELRNSSKWSIYPSHEKNDRCAADSTHSPTLANFFRIQRGIATGCNNFFIMDRADAERRDLPFRYLRPILPSPRHLKAVEIDSDDAGYPLIDRQLFVIDCDLPDTVLETRHPSLWKYLRSADGLGVKDRYLVRKRNPWYKQEKRDPALFLCTYMGRGVNEKQPFRFIWNRSHAVATNLYLMLYPLGPLHQLLKVNPDRGRTVRDILACVSAHELRGAGRVYGGGLHKIEPKELGRISAAALTAAWPELKHSIHRSTTKPLFT
jgi:hypothetical protein